ncbi:MAG TPA: cellulose synthase operon protein YhjQ/BcsQ [Myxococcota bacterium]|nr:cellulose synthase operon protein YhjQ/BcsQ [Myxococcota bacterium]
MFSYLIFSDRPEFASMIEKRIAESGVARVVRILDDSRQLLGALKSDKPEGLFIDLGHSPHAILDLLESLPVKLPLTVVSGPHTESALILRAMHLGVKHFFPPAPTEAELQSVIVDLMRTANPNALSAQGRVVAVMGTKGGVGATLVASQLAASLQELGGRTAIVDLNYPLGDVALHFDIEPTFTLADLARAEQELDSTFVRSILKGHESGVQVLAGPSQMEDADGIHGIHVEQVLPILRSDFDWVVVDTSRSWNDASVAALARADQILLVTLFDVPTLNHARQHKKLLEGLLHEQSRIRTIGNRFAKANAVSVGDFKRAIGSEPDALIPNDYATCAECVNQGRPIGQVARGSAIHKAYQKLALEVYGWCGVDAPVARTERGIAGRFRGAFSRRSTRGAA